MITNEELEQLWSDFKDYPSDWISWKLIAALREDRTRIERLEGGLRFYAEGPTYDDKSGGCMETNYCLSQSPIGDDLGLIARQALANDEEK